MGDEPPKKRSSERFSESMPIVPALESPAPSAASTPRSQQPLLQPPAPTTAAALPANDYADHPWRGRFASVIRIAIRIAADPDLRKELTGRIRENRGHLFDDAAPVRSLQDALGSL